MGPKTKNVKFLEEFRRLVAMHPEVVVDDIDLAPLSDQGNTEKNISVLH